MTSAAGKGPGKIVVDDIDADLFCALSRITVFLVEIVHEKIHIVLDLLIVGLKGLFVVILDGPAEIFILHKGLKDLLLEVVDIFLIQMQVQ